MIVISFGCSVEEISIGDVLSTLKSLANKLRLPGQPKLPYAADNLELPAGVEASEHWPKLATALEGAQVHAQALLDDWDQQQHVAKAFGEAAKEQEGPQGSLKNPVDL
jgi:hypothetical protein